MNVVGNRSPGPRPRPPGAAVARRTATRRESADTRRAALIEAVLSIIAEQGLPAATLRAVADRAGVSNGLIRHYFSGKEQMLVAAYAATVERLTAPGLEVLTAPDMAPRARLRAFLAANLGPPLTTPRMFRQWASFMALIPVAPGMAEVHRYGYLDFRAQIEPLIASVLAQAGRAADATECRALAIEVNALVDGLWLEGSLLPEDFKPGELVARAVAGAEKLLCLTLEDT